MMTRQIFCSTIIALMGLFTITACGGEASQAAAEAKEKKEVADESIAGALNELGKVLEGVGDKDAKPPVDKEKLKALFPDEIDGMKRVSRGVQTGGVANLKGTNANAVYKADGKKLEINIVDGGGLGSSLMDLAKKNFNMEIDQETETGYERTTKIEGYNALEKYNTKRKRGEITIFAYKQFMVNITGQGMEMDVIKSALTDILDELDDLD
ncbi:MAG: hypothetical protein AB8G15_21630 [Saprospiraceae bacterium]